VGIDVPTLGLDPMVGDYLLDAGARSHNLEALIDKYLHVPSIPISELIGSGKNQKSMADVPVERVAEYATEDADYALQIADLIAAQLKREDLFDLYWNLERPLIPVLAEMEYNGIRVDPDELRRQSAELARRLEQLVGDIHRLAGHEFNIDSPLQLRKVLFEELRLPVKKRTKTGPSTDQDVLEELALSHPLPAKIIEHRHLSKLKGTYLDALPALINPRTGRIHCSFNQVVAATGRLSSSDPNLQNIPIRTEEGRRIRKAFVPAGPGWKLVSADYSQIELRMLAHFSQDPVLLEAFAQGLDIHAAVAADVYGVDRSLVTPEMRRVAKAVNFGVIYGQSPFGLAAQLGISQDDAARFIDEYFARYAGVAKFLEDVLAECERTGYARTILGRRRRIEGIRPERNKNRTMPERTAINSVIQGSAADLIKQAMVRIHERLRQSRHPGRMLLQIHDELVFECPEEDVGTLVGIVREEMSSALQLSVPLVVDVTVGDNWLEGEEAGG
jgi:DNA polymerase-1